VIVLPASAGLLKPSGGGPPVFTYATFNPSDSSGNLVLSGGDLTVTRSAAADAWSSVRATQAKSTGKWYWEIQNIADGGVGYLMVGGMIASSSLASWPGGNGADSFGLQPNINLLNRYTSGSHNGSTPGTLASPGDYIYIAIDLDLGKVWMRISNMTDWLGGSSGTPATTANHIFNIAANSTIYPAVGEYGVGQQITANFGAAPFNGSVPSGFNAGWYT
jgi:hypothetical protein